MDLRRRLVCALGIGVFVLASGYASAQTMVVAADAWCPYNCDPQAKKPGYVVEILKAAFSTIGMSVDYRILPWTRALLHTQAGKVGAVIAVNEKEVAEYQLVIGKEPVGGARGCVFVPSSSQFKYRSLQDLDRLTSVGVVGGVVYRHDFGEWLRRPENRQKIHEVFADDASARRVAMMMKGRLDGIFEDYTEMAYVLETKGLQSQIVSAGCQSTTPLYVAFSAKHPRAKDFAATLDVEIQKMRKTGTLKKLLATYGLTDWKSP